MGFTFFGLRSITFHPLKPGTLLFVSQGGPVISRDGGVTWSISDQEIDTLSGMSRAFVINPSDGVIYSDEVIAENTTDIDALPTCDG